MDNWMSAALRSRHTVRAALAASVVAVILGGSGCGPAHIAEYTPKKRQIETPTMPELATPETSGSLWSDENQHAHLFADQRAFRIADIVVVEVEEKADAERSSGTDIDRGSRSGGFVRAIPVIGPLAALALGDMNVDVTAEGGGDTQFRAEGKTGRSERLLATVPSTVQAVMPNGNLIIEGHRVVLVNEEEQHLYVSGVVRPIDIDENNAVKSSKIAEAEIEFVGRGIMTDNAKQGWFSRYFGWVWPF